MAKIHRLKTWPSYFLAVARGDKTFEIRKNDRNFCVGDCLVLEEWDPALEKYTGEMLVRRVVYVVKNCPGFGLMDGYAVLGLGNWVPTSEALRKVASFAER